MKELTSGTERKAVEHEASVMEAMNGKPYALPFHGLLHTEELSTDSSAQPDGTKSETAFLVMG